VSILDNLPDECTIQRLVRTKGASMGSRDAPTVEQTGVSCWEQQVSASELLAFQKRGMALRSKVYFAENPNVSRRHRIVITSRFGTAIAVADQEAWDVLDSPSPDVNVGQGRLFRVMVGRDTAEALY
jgi:hypothetical protein